MILSQENIQMTIPLSAGTSTPYWKPLCKYFGLFSRLHKPRILNVARYASVSELVHSKKYPRKFAQELQVRSTSSVISEVGVTRTAFLSLLSFPFPSLTASSSSVWLFRLSSLWLFAASCSPEPFPHPDSSSAAPSIKSRHIKNLFSLFSLPFLRL